MHAIRLARGYTDRDLILKFEGSYHGAHDSVLWSTAHGDITQVGDARRPRGFKQSWGIPEAMRDLLILAPWNDQEVLAEILEEKGEQIAAVIIEPALGNGAGLLPDPDYLPFLRQQCDEYGIVLIFDEVKTGFRIAPGGASEYFGVHSDLATFAKAMGNGYPIAAIGGKRDIMMSIEPGKVSHGGTYTGNVVGTSAADATLEFIKTGKVFEDINRVGRTLMEGIDEILTRHGLAHHIHGTPGLFGITFSEKKPHDFRDLHEYCDWQLYEDIVMHMIEHGVMPEPEGFEPWFLCSDHTDEDAAETLQKYEDGVRHVLGKR